MRKTVLVLFSIITVLSEAQNIPQDRTMNWEIAGYDGAIPCLPISYNAVDDFNIDNTGTVNVSAAINSTLQNMPENTVLYFPAGTYLINDVISVPQGRILRGESPDLTHFNADMQGEENIFQVIGSSIASETVTQIYPKGDNKLEVSDASIFVIGSVVELEQENNPAVHFKNTADDVDWATYLKGQLLKISDIQGNTIYFDRSFTIDYDSNFNIRLKKLSVVSEVGFENFHVHRLDANSLVNNNNFHIMYASNCWIRNVHSQYTARYHVRLEHSCNIEVRECYFEDADDFAGGGSAYGVLTQDHASECLIENNIFRELRHALVSKEGANRNVYAYNYCRESHSSDPLLIYAVISLHGHYPYYNLFEGNIVERVTITDYWGPAGPGNTLFRNRIYRPSGSLNYNALWTQDYSHDQNFVANELVGTDYEIKDNRDGTVTGSLLIENNTNGTIDNTALVPINDSYYLSAKPDFWTADEPWPNIGTGTPFNTGVIPAEYRWLSGNLIPEFETCYACEVPKLGADQNICDKTSITLNSQLDATDRTFAWYKNAVTIDGETGNALTITQPGTYKLVSNNAGCITEDEIVITDHISIELPEDFTLCSPSMVILDAANNNLPNVQYNWNTGDTTQHITVIKNGTYSVTVSASGCVSSSDEVVVGSELLTVNGDHLPEPGTANISVNETGDYNWYNQMEAGSLLATGSSFSPVVDESTYFYVEGNQGLQFSLGNRNTNMSNGYYNSDFASSRYYFDVLTPVTLNSIKVYAENPQNVTITIKASNGDVIGSVTKSVLSGEQTILLDIDIPVGTNFSIDSEGTTNRLWRDKQDGTWPYTENGYVSIHSTEPAWIATNGYYAFWYDWQFTAGNTCSRTPVLVTVDTNTIDPQITTQSITLHIGWNLVSTFIDADDMTIENIFPNAVKIKSEDYFYDDSQPFFLNTLSLIESGKAYLLYNTANETISISGSTMSTGSLTTNEYIESLLHSGWNMVGVPSDQAIDIATLSSNIDQIKNFKGFYIPNDITSTITHLEPGKGYYIFFH